MFKRVLITLLVALCATGNAWAGLTYSSIKKESAGSQTLVYGTLAFDSSYPTGGETVDPLALGLSTVTQVILMPASGYAFEFDESGKKVLVYTSAAATPAGTLANESAHTHAVALDSGASGATSGGTPSGTNAVSSALDLATPAFSGTGLTAAAQVITTTDNQTMTLNECAGMWLISATGATAPNLILSNTAVTGAPAVLTVQGSANTDAGAYKIVKSVRQIFTGDALATHTHTSGTLADAASGAGSAHTHTFTGDAISAAAMSQVANATNLSAVTGIPFMVLGR